jgi:hypothetical protein
MKTIYKVTQFSYPILNISEKLIPISAADKSVKTVTRSQFIPIDVPTKIKETKLIAEASRRLIIETLKNYSKMDFYKGKFDLPYDNEPYNDTIKAEE